MNFSFTSDTFELIGKTLRTEAQPAGHGVHYRLKDAESGRALTLVITSKLSTPRAMRAESLDNLVTVMTPNSLLQLQGCTGLNAQEDQGKVVFLGQRGGVTNGLVVKRDAGSSLYTV